MSTKDQHFNVAAIQLPVQPTTLIGREREVDELSQLLEEGERMVTLLGPSGTGKTRLAVQVALCCAEHYPDGVAFVGLAPVTDPELLLSSIAGALDIREQAGEALFETLCRELRQRQQLLVIDNFEQLSDAAHLLGTLVQCVPGLALLVTSQVALHQPDEHVYPVPPLDRTAAVELFITRARLVQPNFTPQAADQVAIERIYKLVRGLPLGLELAAAQADRYAIAEIAQTIEQLLTAAQTEAERQFQSHTLMLRRLLAWSDQQLPERERRLFARMGVFSGGCTLRALESVCADQEIDLPDAIAYLLDRNLIIQQEVAHELRWTMLDLITEYARERLTASGEEHELRHRHANYYCQLAEEAEPELRGEHQDVWFGRLEAVHHNLRAALSWLIAQGQREKTLQLAASLWRFWWVRGYLTEGLSWLSRALEGNGAVDQSVELRALVAAGTIYALQGDYPRAKVLLEQGGELALALNDLSQAARAFNNIGTMALIYGDNAYALARLEQSLALLEELTSGGPAIADPLLNLGLAALLTGDMNQATIRSKRALQLYEQMQNIDGQALTHGVLGLVALEQAQHAQAQHCFSLALRLHQQIGHREHIAEGLWNYAAAIAPRDRALAARLGGAGEALFAELGVKMLPLYAGRLNRAKRAALAEHDGQPGWQHWREGHALESDAAVALALDDAARLGAH